MGKRRPDAAATYTPRLSLPRARTLWIETDADLVGAERANERIDAMIGEIENSQEFPFGALTDHERRLYSCGLVALQEAIIGGMSRYEDHRSKSAEKFSAE